MKTVAQMLRKIAPVVTLCLAAVLTVDANTATCVFFHQPKAPEALDRFKRIG